MRNSLILTFILSLALCTFASERSTFYLQRASLFELLPVDSTSIVFLGNSITNGAEWHELFGMPNVVNRGISGDVVDGIEERLDPIVKGQPAKIFLMIGVNDVSLNLSADSIANATLALVQHIRQQSPTTKIYVQSILPVNGSFNRFKGIIGKDGIIREINEMVKNNLDANDATWIDLHSAFSDENGSLSTNYTNDGLHLTGPGYILWRDIIYPYVIE